MLLMVGGKSNCQKIKFPIEKSIAFTTIKTPSVIYANTPGVVITGDYLVVMRSFSGNPLYHVFEMPDCKYMGSFGMLGKGPNEFEVPDVRSARPTEKGFKVFDTHKGLLFVDLTGFSSNKSFKVKQVKLPGELYILNDAVQINDSIIYGMPYVGKTEKLYVRYNLNSSKLDYFGEYPAFFPKGNKDNYWGLIWRYSIVKPDGTKYASFFARFKLFRIYNNSGLLIKEKTMEVPKNILSPKHKSTTYYDVTKATNEYIYALCLNGQLNETDDYPTLEVWDWDGNPVAKLKLQSFVYSFDITQDNKKIYCMDREIDDKIFVYDLENVLK
jgi:hypothetical protein